MLAIERGDVLRSVAEEADQILTVTADESALVHGNAELLARSIDNLVGNAVKYSSPRAETHVSVRRVGQAVTLEVADEGPGIDPDALPHLFDRFYRVPGTDSSGSGLGLALVQEIAAWHGAEVRVTSEPGRGAKFSVRFEAYHHSRGSDATKNPGC
jgi:two-component system sensor histidine kinase TctE